MGGKRRAAQTPTVQARTKRMSHEVHPQQANTAKQAYLGLFGIARPPHSIAEAGVGRSHRSTGDKDDGVPREEDNAVEVAQEEAESVGAVPEAKGQVAEGATAD